MTTSTVTVYPTDEQSWAIMRSVDDVIFPHLRRYASNHLSDQMREWLGEDHGHGISSSDVNHHLASLIRAFDVPMVGPIVEAYKAHGIAIPEWAMQK